MNKPHPQVPSTYTADAGHSGIRSALFASTTAYTPSEPPNHSPPKSTESIYLDENQYVMLDRTPKRSQQPIAQPTTNAGTQTFLIPWHPSRRSQAVTASLTLTPPPLDRRGSSKLSHWSITAPLCCSLFMSVLPPPSPPKSEDDNSASSNGPTEIEQSRTRRIS